MNDLDLHHHQHLTSSSITQRLLVTEATDYAAVHGLLLTPRPLAALSARSRRYINAPITLLPTPTPRTAFTLGLQVQSSTIKLFSRIARDYQFIASSLKSVCEVDDFMARLMAVFTMSYNERPQQYTHDYAFASVRNDYMFHLPANDRPFSEAQLQNVEFNIIAAGLPALSTLCTDLHRHLLTRIFRVDTETIRQHLPTNSNTEGLSLGFKLAFEAYETQTADVRSDQRVSDRVVAMIVQLGEFNIFDQRHIEYDLLQRYNIETVRLTLSEIAQGGRLTDDNILLVTLPDGRVVEVAVAYFRAGYDPNDYPTGNEWAARLTLERSRAIKCPNAAWHLAGTKKIQQVLAVPGVLERFVNNAEATSLRSTFSGLYSLDASEYADGSEGLAKILNHFYKKPESFVLKPQREGGGNNLYGQEAADTLKKLSEKERHAYILMDLIKAPALPAVVLGDGDVPLFIDATTEVGFFGVYLGQADEEQLNTCSGYLLRTKACTLQEGGVAVGLGSIDSAWLV